MRALLLLLLLAGCAAAPLTPPPDSGDPVGMLACRPISEADYARAPPSSITSASSGGLSVTSSGFGLACGMTDDGATCETPGEAYVRVQSGATSAHFHIPPEHIARISAEAGAPRCRMFSIQPS